jgi:hypothetical protein
MNRESTACSFGWWLMAGANHNSGTSAKRDIIILTAGLLLLTNYNLISKKN